MCETECWITLRRFIESKETWLDLQHLLSDTLGNLTHWCRNSLLVWFRSVRVWERPRKKRWLRLVVNIMRAGRVYSPSFLHKFQVHSRMCVQSRWYLLILLEGKVIRALQDQFLKERQYESKSGIKGTGNERTVTKSMSKELIPSIQTCSCNKINITSKSTIHCSQHCYRLSFMYEFPDILARGNDLGIIKSERLHNRRTRINRFFRWETR